MVKEVTAAVTRRNQAAVPADALRALGVKPQGKAALAADDGSVRLAPAAFTLESAFGSVKSAASPTDFDALIRAAKDDKALRTTDA